MDSIDFNNERNPPYLNSVVINWIPFVTRNHAEKCCCKLKVNLTLITKKQLINYDNIISRWIRHDWKYKSLYQSNTSYSQRRLGHEAWHQRGLFSHKFCFVLRIKRGEIFPKEASFCKGPLEKSCKILPSIMFLLLFSQNQGHSQRWLSIQISDNSGPRRFRILKECLLERVIRIVISVN